MQLLSILFLICPMLLTMSVIVKGVEDKSDPSDLGSTNASHPTTFRTKFKPVLYNVTKLYTVPPDTVPDKTSSLTQPANFPSDSGISLAEQANSPSEEVVSHREPTMSPTGTTISPSRIASVTARDTEQLSSGRGGDRIDRTLFALDSVGRTILVRSTEPTISNDKPNDNPPVKSSNTESDTGIIPTTSNMKGIFTGGSVSTGTKSPDLPTASEGRDLPTASNMKDLLTLSEIDSTDSDTGLVNTNLGERLEREIRKNNITQTVDIQLHPSYEPGSDGLEHDKLSEHVRQSPDSNRSTSKTPDSDSPPSTKTLETIRNTKTPDATNRSNNQPEPDEVKYETEEKVFTVFVTPVTPLSSSLTPNDLNHPSTSTSYTVGPLEVVKKSETFSKIKDKPTGELKTKFSSKIKEKTSTVKPAENMTGAGMRVTPVVTNVTSNGTNVTGYEVMNDSPAVQDNVTELAFENTSISADYEELNLTAASSGNATISRTSAQGRMLDVVPPQSPRAPLAHGEDLSNPWLGGQGAFNVALYSGISFGALALVTLLGAVSFIMYRRYRWNKPQTLSDKCSNPDSSGYIDDSTLRENSEEMYSLDNDSFLNSLEAMTIQNYWTDHVKHTKL